MKLRDQELRHRARALAAPRLGAVATHTLIDMAHYDAPLPPGTPLHDLIVELAHRLERAEAALAAKSDAA